MTARDKRILLKFKRLLSKRVRVNRMVLFGSRARGDHEAGSDMDVLVILEDEAGPEERDYVCDCAWEAGYREGLVLVPIAFSRDEWESGPERQSLLAKAVEAEGVAV
jgi:uncharacterized protein